MLLVLGTSVVLALAADPRPRQVAAGEADASRPWGVSAGAGAPAEWRRNSYSGVNCLYVTLRMLGTPVSYERLVEGAAVGPAGSSLAELARLAREHGVRLTPMRGARDGLESWPLPAIVPLQNGPQQSGQYVVLLSRGGGSFTTLDCTSGELRVLAESDFFPRWNGFVLLRSEAPSVMPQGWKPYAWLIVCLWSFAFGLWQWWDGRPAAQASGAGSAAAVLTGPDKQGTGTSKTLSQSPVLSGPLIAPAPRDGGG